MDMSILATNINDNNLWNSKSNYTVILPDDTLLLQIELIKHGLITKNPRCFNLY